MTRDEAERLSLRWIELWNSRDLEGVLRLCHEDMTFHSPKAAALIGQGVVHGKAALRSYWTTALERNTKLHFTLDHVAFDSERQELFIVYVAELGTGRNRACERLRFSGGLAIDGEGLYGAPL